MRSDQEVREQIDDAIEYFESRSWGSLAWARERIGKAVGRILLTNNEVEWHLDRYRGCWRADEYGWLVAHRLEPVCYGDHYKQRWYLLRDLVPITREWRRIRRKRRFCSICGTLASFEEQQQCAMQNPSRTNEFCNLIMERHFTTFCWEIPGPMTRKKYSTTDRSWQFYLDEYWKERDPRQLCCGARCEATRFSRWYGLWHYRVTQEVKSEKRYRKEQQWIREGKQALKQIRQYLQHQPASKSPLKESTPASISHVS